MSQKVHVPALTACSGVSEGMKVWPDGGGRIDCFLSALRFLHGPHSGLASMFY
jgi:hypothetical protein